MLSTLASMCEIKCLHQFILVVYWMRCLYDRSPSVASVEDEEYKDESEDEPAELIQVECSKETLESKQNGDYKRDKRHLLN